MTALLGRLLSPDRLVPPSKRCGALPGAKSAVQTLMRIAWPSMLEMVLVTLVGMVDMMMVGGLGSYAISSVGLTTQPKLIFLTLFFAINVGCTSIIARRKGEGDRDGAGRCLRQTLMLSAGFSLLLTGVAILFAPQVMAAAGANRDTLGPSSTYFRIVMASLFFHAISLNISAAQRGCGQTRVAMKINLTANAVNIALNYLLIEGNLGFPQMGVAGAALATSIGTAAGCVVAVRSLFHRDGFLSLSARIRWRFDRKTLRSLWNLSSNALLEQIAMRTGFFLYAVMVANLGTEAFASYQITAQILSLSYTFGDGIGVAATSLVGQNLGARRPDLSVLYTKLAQRLGYAVSGLLILLFCTFRYPIVGMFTDDSALIGMTVPMILLAAVAIPMQNAQPITSGCLRGAGDTRFVAWTMLISIMLVRPLSCALFLY